MLNNNNQVYDMSVSISRLVIGSAMMTMSSQSAWSEMTVDCQSGQVLVDQKTSVSIKDCSNKHIK